MKKIKLIAVVLLAVLLAAGAAGAGVWWLMKSGHGPAPAGHAEAPAPVEDKKEYKYLNLDKVIVMLRAQEGAPLSNYIAVDLVFKTPKEGEAAVKNQLPLLRSLVVKALSNYTLEQAGLLTIDELTAAINQALDAAYTADGREKPFSMAMIGKLIIE